MSSSKTTTTTGAGAGAGVVDVLDGIIGLTPSLREEEGRAEDVGGRKRGEVDDGDDDDGGDAGAGRKRARFDPTRDTVLVVPARQKKEDSGRPPTGEELLALAEEEASDRTALVFEPTLRGARQACKSLDRALRRNRASRDEHPDDPAKFVDDEVALNDAVLCLKDAAADVGLYPELVECGMADSLLTLLGHENVDVAAGAVEVLAELLDPSLLLVVVASGDDDGNGGGNAPSSSSSGGRAGCVASLANAFVDGGGLDLLSSNLGRLDESVDEESRCAEEVLALVESLLDLDRAGALGRGPPSSSPSGDGGGGGDEDDGGERPSVAACICERTSLVPWLFERIGRTADDPGAAAAATSPPPPDSLRLHSSEVLSAILQHEDYSANMRGPRLAALPRYASAFDDGDGDGGGAAAAAKTVDGMDALLLAVAAHRKSDPTSDAGCEFLENALDALAASLLRHDNVADFVEAEGVELMLRCVRQRVHAGGGRSGCSASPCRDRPRRRPRPRPAVRAKTPTAAPARRSCGPADSSSCSPFTWRGSRRCRVRPPAATADAPSPGGAATTIRRASAPGGRPARGGSGWRRRRGTRRTSCTRSRGTSPRIRGTTRTQGCWPSSWRKIA